MWGIFWSTLFILVNGFAVFFEFNASDFLVAYINIPLFAGLYIGWKVYKRTKIWKPQEMDFVTVRIPALSLYFHRVGSLTVFVMSAGCPVLGRD